ncbi:MAG: hypothetical protein IJO57_01400 [Bacilli bacterium]|nr:hypothetical protein [Bacilli bacterium]
MDKKRILITVSIILVLIVTGIFFYKKTFSVTDKKYDFENLEQVTLSKTNMQKLIVRTANAFYKNKDYIQYDGSYYAETTDNKYMFRNLAITPEELNMNNMVYMDNISFIHSVYLNSIYYNLTADITNSSVNYATGEKLDIEDVLSIIEKRDNRLVVDGNSSVNDTTSKQESFISYYKRMLEEGDIIVYTTDDDETYLALYVGNNECMYLYGDSYNLSTGENKLEANALYKSSVDSYLFNSNKFKDNVKYYAILRPINVIDFKNEEVTYKIPVNSLSRIDNVFVRKYNDVNSKIIYPGENVNYTIEIINDSLDEVTLKNVTEKLSDNLVIIDTNNGSVNNNVITWNNVSIPAMSSIKLNYKVMFNKLINDNFLITNEGTSISLNSYTMNISGDKLVAANKFISYQGDKINKVVNSMLDNKSIFEYSTDLEYKDDYKLNIESSEKIHLNNRNFVDFVYYNSLGYDFTDKFQEYFDANNMIQNFFVKDGDNYKINIDFENNDIFNLFSKFLVYYGGKKSLDKTNNVFSSVNNSNYSFNNLIYGDIIIIFESENDILLPNLYLYLGDDKFVSYDGNFNLYAGNNSNQLFDSLYSQDLYLIFRPSYIFDIPLDDVEISPINLKLNGEEKINYKKIPSNASINKIEYSESDKYLVNNDTIKGLVTGNHILTIRFNDKLTKEVNVSIMKEVYNFSFNTKYDVDEDNKIIYVGEDNSVSTIIDNITVSESNIDINIYDLEHNKLTDLVDKEAVLEISSNNELIRQYRVVSLEFSPSDGVQIVRDENIIRYIEDDSTADYILKMFKSNDKSVKFSIKNTEGLEITDSTVLATGNILSINVSNKLNYSYQLSILGDVSGNGVFNPNDLIRTRRYFVGWVDPTTNEVLTLEGPYYYALDITKNDIINLNDLIEMRRKLVDG